MIPIERVEKLDPARLLRRDAQAEADVSAAVDDVIEAVRTRGDEALRDYTRRFDGAELTDLRVTEAEIQAAWEATDADFRRRKTSAPSTAARSTRTSFSPGRAASSWASGTPPLKRWACACPGARWLSPPPF